ncbi:MAG TPA: replication-associated recombination protein A [Spirochaetes bacterium]|nr:replication-associated recombination protein A [Spirochaetota bacterium]
MSSLFSDSFENDEPLAKRLAPGSIDDFFGQEKIIGTNGAVRKFIENDKLISCIFHGPPGSGKTALARIMARMTKSDFVRLNAVTAKIDDLRAALKRAVQNRMTGTNTILFIDEIHRFNKMQQDGLLPALEEGTVILIGTTTKNPYFSLIPPLRSRVLLFEFEKLPLQALEKILMNAAAKESLTIDDDARKYLKKFANGDARRMLNLLEAAVIVSKSDRISVDSFEKLIKKQPVLYDRDENYHYDVISAFIKSVRGSDPDAALYWLALMIEGGEDPLFIARRLIILSCEDIGLADPQSLVLAQSAYEAVDNIGMPEARIILSHLTIYLTLQPKSNSGYKAVDKALEYIRTHENLEVPAYLRSTHPENKNYRYPHDHKYHYVIQDYVGKKVQFYDPGELGNEKELKKRLEFFKQMRSRETG